MNIMSLSVKKSALAVVVCSSLGGIVPAMADAGNPTGSQATSLTMHVVGSITKSTCDIRPYTSAGADATTLNLGVASATSFKNSDKVTFFLKSKNGCSEGIIETSGSAGDGASSADITWDSNGLTDHGISNMYGTATNVHLALTAEKGDGTSTALATSGNGAITNINQTVKYSIKQAFGSSALPFEYSAMLEADSGKTVGGGTFDTDISYTVAYN